MRTLSLLINSRAWILFFLLFSSVAWADSLTLVSGAGQTGLGGSTSAQPIVAQVRNAAGVAVSGRTIYWTSNNGFVLSAASSVTDANGLASITFTYGNYGTTAIVATDPIGATTGQALQTSTGSDSLTLISGGGQAGKVGTSTQPIVVEIRNAAGNPVLGRTVTWRDQTIYTRVSAPSSVTNASGRASMNFSYVQNPPGIQLGGGGATIRATNSLGPQFADASVTVLGVDIVRLLSVQTQSGLVGSSGTPIIVQVTTWDGAPIPGATVTWKESLSTGRVALSSNSTVTNTNGQASITFQYLLPGQGEITATLASNGIQAEVSFVSVSAGSLILVSPNGVSGAPGSVSQLPVIIEDRADSGQFAVGRTINWRRNFGDAVLAAASSVTNASGRASVGFTYGTVASGIRGTDPVSGKFADVYLPVAPQDGWRVVSGQGQTGVVGQPAAQPIVVEALGATGAPAVGRTINWINDPGISLAAATSTTDASGRASINFTYTDRGSLVIRGRDLANNGVTVIAFVSATGINAMSPISGSGQSGLVGTHGGQTLVAELRDASGQPAAGRTITWSLNVGNATVDAASSITDASGRASMGFTYGPTASLNAVHASDNTGGVHADFLVTGVGANALSLISGNGQTGPQNTAGAQPLVVEVRDASGLPVARRSINWTAIAGSAVPSASSSLTDASGRASMGFTYGSSTSTLTATDSVSAQQVRFTVAGTQAVGTARIVSGDGQTGLPGTAGIQPIVIELRDANNAPRSGQAVTWSVVSGPATLAAVTNNTDASGQASASFNFGTTSGASIIQARDTGTGQLLQATATALAGPAGTGADSLVLMSGAGQTGLGGSASAQPIVVQVRNVNGTVVVGRTINWTAGDGFVLSAATSITDASGLASVSFTYGNTGTTVIVASDPVSAMTARALATSTGSDSLVVLSGGGQAGRAGSASAQPIVVELRNAAGNPVVGRTINWTDQTTYTRVDAAASATDVNGRASMGFTYLQGPPAVAGAAATIRATNSTGSPFVDASVDVLGFDVLRMVSVGSQSGLIGSAGSPVVVQLTDWNGAAVPGATVTWYERLSSGLVALSATSTVTDATGKTSITFQYLKPGAGEITAEYGLSAIDMHFVSVGSDHMVLISPNNTYGAPGSHSTSPIVVEARDVNNQPIAGRTIQWGLYFGDAVLDAPTSVTDASGRTSMGFTHGTVLSGIYARDLLVTNANPSEPNYASDADSYSNPTNPANQYTMRLVSGSGQSGLAGTAGAQPLVVEILNASGNPVVGLEVFFRRSIASNVVLDPALTFTDASGRASMTFTYGGPGQSMIEAARNFGTPTGTAAYVQFYVTATGIDTLIGISGSDQSGLVGTHSAQPLVAELRNASGQPVAGRSITWIVNGGNAVFDALSSVTDAAGRASMGFTYGPTASINGLEARDSTTGVHIGYFATAVGANSINLISGTGQTGVQNTAGAQPLVIEVRDAAGQPVAGRSISWNMIAGDAVLSAPSSLTDASGRASIGFSYGSSTTSTVVAIDPVSGQQVRFTVTGIPAVANARILSGNGQSGLPGTAGAQPIVIELRDGSNAPLSGKAVSWTVVSGPATLATVTNITDASGQASASFNFGATPGTSVIQVRDASSGQLLQAAVTARGSNQTLALVSGDAQTVVVNVASAPLVVLLKDFSNAPVAGATITWSTSNGTLASASTVTDASGQSSNTVTVANEGSVTVTANSPLASAPITFTLTGGIADLPNLTPQQQSVAGAVDILCPALAAQGTLTPQQADLLARCQELAAAAQLNPGATANALQELLSDTGQAQTNAAVAAVSAQFQNINTRLTTLRTGAPLPVSLSGLSFIGSGGAISLASLMNALAGDEKSPQKPETFSRWGFFASGNIGRGESDAARSSPAYDYDIEGLTFGLDYRQRDSLVLGAALGLTRQDTDLAGDQGNVKMSGWSLSSYGTYSFKDIWYLDSVVTWGRNQYEMNRRIAFTVPRPGGGSTSINQLATGNPDGDLLSLALTFGGDFHKDALGISPYGQVLYSRTGFDAYQESLQTGPGSGLGLAVESRNVTALTGVLGSRFTYTHSTDWGVVIPTASVEWTHEFKDDPEAISASFIYDPTHTIFSVAGTRTDSDYLRMSVGLSMVLAHGRSGFFQYQWMAARDGQSQYNLSLGMRVEF